MCKLNSEFPLLKYGASSRIWERERVPVPRNAEPKRVPVPGNAEPERVPVSRNPGTRHDLIQMKRIGISEHLRILESAWKPVFKRVPVSRERNPEVRER